MAQGFIYDQYGNHASKHQDGGADEISVAGLSGLLADDQHVLDSEVLAAVQVKLRVYLSTDQVNLLNATWTKVLLDTKNYDVGSNFDNITNYRFTVPTAGYYLITAGGSFKNTVLDKRYAFRINKNSGTEISIAFSQASYSGTLTCRTSDILFLSVNDTIQLDAYSESGDNTVDIAGEIAHTFMAIHLLSI